MIKIKYHPTIVGAISASHYRVTIFGTSTSLLFDCVGEASGFEVYFSSQAAQFG